MEYGNINIKKCIVIFFCILLFFVIGVLIFVLPIRSYLDHTPKLTIIWTGEAVTGQTIDLYDLVNVECKGDYHLELSIDTDIADAYVSEDKGSLYVGSQSGYITVIVSGSGTSKEFVSKEIVVYVR